MNQNPALFGLQHSNRDFTLPESWGKNQFNSSFPTALACYMGSKNIDPVYLVLNPTFSVVHHKISVQSLLGLPYNSPHLFFSFEDSFTPYTDLIIGSLPRVDLVTRHRGTEQKQCLSALEIKLTALPDNSTVETNNDSLYGCEIVTRPDTIIYLALSIAQQYLNQIEKLKAILSPVCSPIVDWSEAHLVRPHLPQFINAIKIIFSENLHSQIPLLIQPIWKTLGKKSSLANNCLDMFVWSNLAFAQLFMNQAYSVRGEFTRPERAVIWLIKMLEQFSTIGKINPSQIIDSFTYNTKNDKAFAVSGKITNPYMRSPELTTPRIPKQAIQEIILGGGQNFLSPERRLDAIILNSPNLFEEDIT